MALNVSRIRSMLQGTFLSTVSKKVPASVMQKASSRDRAGKDDVRA